MYMVTTFVFFCLGGVEALMMRLQLGTPNNTLVSPETYNQLFTMHGTTMIFLFVVPMMAGLANYFRAADDRRARHGLSAPERAVLLAALGGRDRLLRLALLEPAGSRLDQLRAALQRDLLHRAAARTHGST